MRPEEILDVTIPQQIKMDRQKLKMEGAKLNIKNHISYRIIAFNKTFNVVLNAKHEFIAPHYVLEYQQKLQVHESWIKQHNKYKDFFHLGEVLGDPDSMVSLSISNNNLVSRSFLDIPMYNLWIYFDSVLYAVIVLISHLPQPRT